MLAAGRCGEGGWWVVEICVGGAFLGWYLHLGEYGGIGGNGLGAEDDNDGFLGRRLERFVVLLGVRKGRRRSGVGSAGPGAAAMDG